ncbi:MULTISPECIES: TadE/TadG family type IV pilus assembly protein [unclassified Vibrio]|uniref:TadE/TadG family type IV pilus assembly protein n=1 Tax=Vibrio sp. HB236076 TaxID=3232307 RepID=A0AB39HJK9_9VIBR|nr:TadE/TadG family type IV pilus assembly protein [Vibrio sp. HB161653]MDP5253167.1 pilus assembly protein [Vibrio sp. HB161653]
MKRQSGLLHSKVIAKHRQLGVAGIWAALTLVPVMGFTFLAVEGTRYVQESSRLKDSAEAAALAVTIQDNDVDDADVMAEKYVKAYVRDIASDTVTSTRTYDDDEGYVQYDVTATTTHDSWFASNFIPSFNDTQTLVSESTAKKYFTYADKNIDVVFVADFSGSMNWEWGESEANGCSRDLSCKIDTLKDAIATVSESILCNEVSSDGLTCNDSDVDIVANKLDNRVGIVPFNLRTREKGTSGNTYAVSQLRYTTSYENVDWTYWAGESYDTMLDCYEKQNKCSNKTEHTKNELHQQASTVNSVLKSDSNKFYKYKNKQYYYLLPDSLDYIDFSDTVDDMFTSKFSGSYETFFDVSDIELFSDDYSQSYPYYYNSFNAYFGDDNEQFYNIELTNSLSKITNNITEDMNDYYKKTASSGIYSMDSDGSTAVFQGMLRGFQILNDGKPDNPTDEETETYNDKVKILLIVTDGQESPDFGTFEQLVSSGMCETADSEITNLYIGIVGVSFNIEKTDTSLYNSYLDCISQINGITTEAAEDFIYEADEPDELVEYIEELIAKGASTSGVTTLY